MKTCFRLGCALLAFTAVAVAQAAAPTMPGPERLPPDTWILINWHGVDAATRVQSTNPVMRLWKDPQLATAREQLVRTIAARMAADEGLDAALSRASIDDVLSVLENPVTVGVSGDVLGPEPADGLGKVHFYAVLNLKGKGAEWTRLQKEQAPKPGAEVSTYSFRGVQVKKTVTTTPPPPAPEGSAPDTAAKPKVRHSLEASLGDYQLLSDHQPLMESLIARLQESRPTAASLRDDAAYQRAQRFRAEGALFEAFLKVPDISRIPIPPAPQIDMGAALRELHLERIQGAWLSAGMGRDRMLMRGALLGDFTPGGLLDVVGGNVRDFPTLAVAPANGSYAAFRLDLPALYATLLRAVRAGLPPDQAAAANVMLDGLVAVQTGMRTSELLALFTGEIGMASTGEDLLTDALSGMLMLPTARSEAVLGLIRTVAGGLVQGEEKLGNATLLRIVPPPTQAGAADAATAGPSFHVAVTPTMALVSPDRARLQEALARAATAAAAPAGSLAADRTFQAARRALPAELNGLNYTDVARYDWAAQLEQLRRQAAAQSEETLRRAAGMEKGDAENPPDPEGARELRERVASGQAMQQVIEVLFPLLPKYLKTSTGGSWKAADGWYFESFVD